MTALAIFAVGFGLGAMFVIVVALVVGGDE